MARDGAGRVRLFGELDACEVRRVRACLVGVDGDVELDCSGLRFVDAAGLGWLSNWTLHVGREVRSC